MIAIASYYYEFAPSLLSDWASGGQKFGSRASATVTAWAEYYKDFPLFSKGADSQKFSELGSDSSFPTWLANKIEKVEVHIPPNRRSAFRQRVREAKLVKADFNAFRNQLVRSFPFCPSDYFAHNLLTGHSAISLPSWSSKNVENFVILLLSSDKSISFRRT